MKFKSLTFAVLAAVCALAAEAKMTDSQVVDYIKQQTALGKSEQQIGRELVARGVTQDQVARIKAEYNQQQTAAPKTVSTTRERSAIGRAHV